MTASKRLELVCPAGTPAAFRVAVDSGAHAVYCGFNDETNARNFPGLNFSREEMDRAIEYAHRRGAKTLIAINTFPRAGEFSHWAKAVEDAARFAADAVIVADLGLLDFAAARHPSLRLHLSVQAAAANADAINFYARSFDVKRVVLPRVLTVQEIAAINREIDVETEVFIFGGLCVMAEGRCSLSSYATGKSPNMNGACSPASHVEYREEGADFVSRLGGFTIHRVAKGEAAPYPTLCKGSFQAGDYSGHVFEDPASLDAASLIPQLAEAGVTALKIEGRQRSRAYTEAVVRSFRRAVDAYAAQRPIPTDDLRGLTEGQQTTSGAYRKVWR